MENNNQNFNQNNNQTPYQDPNQAPNQIPQNNNMPVAALICGLLALVFWFIPLRYFNFINLLFSILAIVFGAKGRQTASPNQTGMATAGMVLGIIGVVLYLVSIVCIIAACTAIATIPWL